MSGEGKGKVCVTGGTGFVASWLVLRLLEQGYSVNTTIRASPGRKRDVSFLTNLPGASERLQIFTADLDQPDSFGAAIEGCVGVFHLAHPLDFDGKETEESKTKRSVEAAIGILQASVKAKTVKKVVYTSGVFAIMFDKGKEIVDENSWSDLDTIRSLKLDLAIAKVLTEKACMEFAEKNGLDLVTVIPSWIHGPFITPNLSGSLRVAPLALFFGDKHALKNYASLDFVHNDDLARAHIFLFEHPEAKGRYICSNVDVTVEELVEFLHSRYPQYQLPTPELAEPSARKKTPKLSTKKLLDIGFQYKYGLAEMYEDAIKSCKEKGIL